VKELSQSFAKQSALVGTAHMVAMVGGFLSQIIISRIFGPEGRGVFANTFALRGFLILLLGTGHEVSNTYFVASGRQKVPEAAGSSLLGFFLSTILLILVTVLITLFRPSFVSPSNNLIIILAVSSIPLTWGCLYLYALIRGLGRSDLSYMYYALSSLTWIVMLVFMCYVLLFRKLEVVFIARIFSAIIPLLVGLWLIKKLNGPLKLSFTLRSFKESIIYGVKQIVSKLANPMAFRVEMLILPMLYVTTNHLGLYAQGVAILDRILILPLVGGYVLMAKVAKESQKSVDVTATLCRLSFMTTLVLGLSVMLLAKFLVPFLFGAKFAPAVLLMWIMFPGMVIRSIPRVLRNYFLGTGEPGKVSIAFILSTLTMILVSVLLVGTIGIAGAAVGILLSCMVECGVMLHMFKCKVNLGLRDMCLINKSDMALIKDRVVRLISRNAKS